MKVWALMEDDLNEGQTASEHLIGLFANKDDVIKEIKAQCEGYECRNLDFTDSFGYALKENDGETYTTFEAELVEIK